MEIRTVILTTSPKPWFMVHEKRIRQNWGQARGITTTPFEVRHIKLDKVPLKRDNDGDMKPDWDWFRQTITAQVPGFNNVVLHLSRKDKKRLGIQGVQGSYKRDSDDIFECFIIADGDQMNDRYKNLPTFVWLMLHEPGHGAAHWLFGYDTDIVHHMDYDRRDIERLWSLFDFTEHNRLTAERDRLTGLLQSMKDALTRRMDRPMYFLDDKYFEEAMVSQRFGVWNTRYRSDHHPGTDYRCPVGTPVFAPMDCTIVKSDKGSETGNYIHITFMLDGERYWMRFLHLSKGYAPGQYRKGEVIALTGNTGDTDGPHLHSDLWRVAIDVNLILTAEGVRKYLLDDYAFFRKAVEGIG